jgi:hypothetical protein
MEVAGILLLITLLVLLVLSSASLGLGASAYKKSQIPILNKDGNASKVTNLNASSFATGTLLEERISTTSLLGTVRPFTTQKGTPEITLVASGGNVDWDTTASQSAFIDLIANATMRLPQNMINGFTYVLNVKIATLGPVLSFTDPSYRFANSVTTVTTSSIVQMVTSNGIITVVISPIVSQIAALHPSHWYNTRLPNAYTVDNKQNVLTWKDFGTSNNSLSKAGGGGTLPLVQNALNEIAGISFSSSPTLQGLVSFFSVVNNAQTTQFLVCKKSNINSAPILVTGNIMAGAMQVTLDPLSNLQCTFTITDAGERNTTFSSVISDLLGNVKVLTGRSNNDMWENGHSLETTGVWAPTLIADTTSPFILGQGFTGFLSEVIIFNRELTDDEVDAVFDELLPIYDLPDV